MAPDAHFEHPRLAAVYDALDPDRSDLLPHLALAEELGARSVLDIGCGTGVLALLLAERGTAVTGLDPAGGSLAVARAKPGADAVRWVHGDTSALAALDPPVTVDLAVMTGNAAQAITDDAAWAATLRAAHDALVPGGHLVLETREPSARAWEGWTEAATRRTEHLPGVGAVETWVRVTRVDLPFVAFTTSFVFATDGAVLESRSLLRFRSREEVEDDLARAGLTVLDVRDAPDRPGLELVLVSARSPGAAAAAPPRTTGR